MRTILITDESNWELVERPARPGAGCRAPRRPAPTGSSAAPVAPWRTTAREEVVPVQGVRRHRRHRGRSGRARTGAQQGDLAQPGAPVEGRDGEAVLVDPHLAVGEGEVGVPLVALLEEDLAGGVGDRPQGRGERLDLGRRQRPEDRNPAQQRDLDDRQGGVAVEVAHGPRVTSTCRGSSRAAPQQRRRSGPARRRSAPAPAGRRRRGRACSAPRSGRRRGPGPPAAPSAEHAGAHVEQRAGRTDDDQRAPPSRSGRPRRCRPGRRPGRARSRPAPDPGGGRPPGSRGGPPPGPPAP